MSGVYCIQPVVVFTLVVPCVGPLVTRTVDGSNVPSGSASFANTLIHMGVSSSVVAVSSFAVGGSFTSLIVMLTVAAFDVAPSSSLTV